MDANLTDIGIYLFKIMNLDCI